MMMIKLFKNYLFVYRFIAMRLMQSYVFFRNQTTFATILPQISISGGALVSARLCRLPEQEVHQPSKRWSLPQIARIYTEAACWGCSPTEYAEFTEALAEWSSHRLHRFTQKLLTSGGALVSSAPTKQEVHQPSKQWFSHRLHRSTQNCLLGMFSHRFHRFTQKLLILGGIKTRKRHAPKGQKHIAQGSALGKYAQH